LLLKSTADGGSDADSLANNLENGEKLMIEIRFHGRGGQGAVTSAELTALAAIEEGKFAQAFPSFGPERRGAPVMAFVRVSEEQIRTREKVYNPNILVVLNTKLSAEQVRSETGIKARLALVDAGTIAMEEMRVPITNTTMLGALLKAAEFMPVEALRAPIEKRFGPIAERNIKACMRAYQETTLEG
jgi:pyruvate ferredoxin oxidoreductase gamma subunit